MALSSYSVGIRNDSTSTRTEEQRFAFSSVNVSNLEDISFTNTVTRPTRGEGWLKDEYFLESIISTLRTGQPLPTQTDNYFISIQSFQLDPMQDGSGGAPIYDIISDRFTHRLDVTNNPSASIINRYNPPHRIRLNIPIDGVIQFFIRNFNGDPDPSFFLKYNVVLTGYITSFYNNPVFKHQPSGAATTFL